MNRMESRDQAQTQHDRARRGVVGGRAAMLVAEIERERRQGALAVNLPTPLPDYVMDGIRARERARKAGKLQPNYPSLVLPSNIPVETIRGEPSPNEIRQATGESPFPENFALLEVDDCDAQQLENLTGVRPDGRMEDRDDLRAGEVDGSDEGGAGYSGGPWR